LTATVATAGPTSGVFSSLLVGGIPSPDLARTFGAIVACHDWNGDERDTLAAWHVLSSSGAWLGVFVDGPALVSAHGAGDDRDDSAAPVCVN